MLIPGTTLIKNGWRTVDQNVYFLSKMILRLGIIHPQVLCFLWWKQSLKYKKSLVTLLRYLMNCLISKSKLFLTV